MRKSFCLLVVCLMSSIVYGQPDLDFEHLDTSHGLSQSWVNSIAQDQLGFLWICTQDGVNRYDGYRFEIIDKMESGGVRQPSTGAFYCFFQSPDGEILLGTAEGVYAYDKKANVISRRQDLPNGDIYEIAGDRGGLWIGSYDLHFYDSATAKIKSYYANPSVKGALSGHSINAIFRDSRRNLWVGTGSGLNIYNRTNDSFLRYFSDDDPNSLSDNDIRSIEEDKFGRLWIGTQNGLNLVTGPVGRCTFRRFLHNSADANSLARGTVLSLNADDDWLWVGTENGGLDLLDINHLQEGVRFHHHRYDIRQPKGISNNSIHCIFKDVQDNVWIGTFAAGLNKYSPQGRKFKHYYKAHDKSNSLINNQVNAFLEVGSKVWIGTEGGLSVMDKSTGSFEHFTHDPNDPGSLGADAVWCIYQDHGGTIWVGTWGGGLNKLNRRTGKFTRYVNDPNDHQSLSNNNVFAIYEDGEQMLWIGTMGGGLNKMIEPRGRFRRFGSVDNGLATNFVEQIVQTQRGELLLANVRGVYSLNRDNQSFEPFMASDSTLGTLGNENVFAISEDQWGRLFIGSGSGMYWRLPDEDQLYKLTIKDGLPYNVVKSIAVDQEMNIWLGTNRGLSKVTLDSTGKGVEAIKTFTAEDGLQSNEFNRRSSLYSSDGTMFFGGVNGFNAFVPDQIESNTYLPRTVFTDFYVFNEKVEIGTSDFLHEHISLAEEIVLPYSIRVFGLGFVGLNYVSPEKNQYAYILEGFDDQWSYVGNRREVTYTNLSPGDYTLKVKSSNNDGVWGEPTATVDIKILPPFWRSYYAYALYILLVILLLYLFRRYSVIDIERKRDLQIAALEKEKEAEINKSKLAFFTNISHEIRTPLTLIDGPVQNLINHGGLQERNRQQLELVNRNVKRLLHLINQLLDFRKIDTGHVKLQVGNHKILPIIQSIGDVFSQQAEMQQIDFRISCEDPELTCWVDEEKLTTIMYNLISNAFKYIGDEHSVTIDIRAVDIPLESSKKRFNFLKSRDQLSDVKQVEIKVTDNGIGIARDKLDSIFDRFYQADANAGKSASSGIGLNIVKEYVNRHHGTITVESEQGKGSCFTVLLPNQMNLYQPEELQLNPNSSTTTSKEVVYRYTPELTNISRGTRIPDLETIEGRPTLMVAEDEKDLLFYIISMLKDDYNLVYTSDGQEALEKIREQEPDMLISDIVMPGMTGLELTKTLRSELESSHIPIILLSAKADYNNKIEGLEQGADVYLAKPVNKEILNAHIKSLLVSREKLKKLFRRQVDVVSKEITVTALDESFFDELLNVLNLNISETVLDITDLASEMGMSTRALASKIRAITGQEIEDFIISMKLKKAAQLLERSPMPVDKVARLVGFPKLSTFSRLFLEEFGIAPAQYAGDEHA